LSIPVFSLEIQLSDGGWDPITSNRFSPTTCFCLSPDSLWISNAISRCLYCTQWFEVRGVCSLWWNCWPSLFKLSFHNTCKENACENNLINAMWWQ
jgi:hypothetical protein